VSAKLLRVKAAAATASDPFHKDKDIDKVVNTKCDQDGSPLLPRVPAKTKGSVKPSKKRAPGRVAAPAPASASAPSVAAFDTGFAAATAPSLPGAVSGFSLAPPDSSGWQSAAAYPQPAPPAQLVRPLRRLRSFRPPRRLRSFRALSPFRPLQRLRSLRPRVTPCGSRTARLRC
jgi:hypothetical protein